MEKQIRTHILELFPQIKQMADESQICKRKGVGAAIMEIDIDAETIVHWISINGPSGPRNECSNVVGACGCSHAEPRVIMQYLKYLQFTRPNRKNIKTILLSTYSPCVPCANITIDSGIIDAFIYEIWTPHWNKHPFHADDSLHDSDIIYWTKENIESQGILLLKDWLAK